MTTTTSSRIQVKLVGGKRVDAVIGEQVIHTDQSMAHGGQGSAPEPFDLFLASLATCAGLDVLVFCQARAIPTDRLSLVQDQVFEDGRLLGVRLSIVVPADFPEKISGRNSYRGQRLQSEEGAVGPAGRRSGGRSTSPARGRFGVVLKFAGALFAK